MDSNLLKQHIDSLVNYVESEKFKGYDPYDILNSRPLSKLGKWPAAILTQVHKRSPFNYRKLLGIQKEYNPKAMGLFLEAYSTLYAIEPKDHYKQQADWIFNWLQNNYSNGFSGMCWGYNFQWANPQKVVEKYHPSLVVTGFVCKGIVAYYNTFGNKEALSVLQSAKEYILKDLPRTESTYGICLSYTDLKKDCVYNASLLGAETLAFLYNVTKEEEIKTLVFKLIDFVIHHQQKDGSWNYSIDMASSKERTQIDFHQGYVVESIHNCCCYMFGESYSSNKDAFIYSESIKKGMDFYYTNQFTKEGISLWRYPQSFPVDIHNQAQGIITFALLKEYDKNYLAFAQKIADWTCLHMHHNKGFFYYRKHKYYTNKQNYIRWNNAWMLVAIIHLLKAKWQANN